MADSNSNTNLDVSQAQSNMENSINNFVANVEGRNAQKRAYKYWEKSVDKMNEINTANYERQKQDNIDWALNSKVMEVQALRNAGLNPSWSQEGAGNVSASSSAPTAMESPSGHDFGSNSNAGFMNTIAMQQLQLQTEMQKAQIESLHVSNEKTKAETENIEENTGKTGLENLGKREENFWSSKVISEKIRFDHITNSFYKDTGETDEAGMPIYEMVNFTEFPKTKAGVDAMHAYEKMCNDNSIYQSTEVENRLKTIVGQLQVSDKKVLDALAQTPQVAFENLKAAKTQTELDNEVKKIQRIVWRKLGKLDDDRLQILGAILLNYAKQ